MTSAITHRRLEPFGVEARIDIAKGLTESDKEELRRLYALDGVLVIAGLNLTMDQQIELCGIFGPVLRGSAENYLVSNVHEDGMLGAYELRFHNDIAFVPAPYLGGSLHALEISDGASGTRFASGMRAYERLPQRLRDRIDGKNALFVRKRSNERRSKLTDLLPGDICAVHAVVQRQKDTGRPFLFVNTNSAGQIIGMPEAESDDLLEELFSYLYQEDDVFEHSWTKGDFVVWDNLALQHARTPIRDGVRRTLQRVTIAKYGYLDQYPMDGQIYERIRNAAV